MQLSDDDISVLEETEDAILSVLRARDPDVAVLHRAWTLILEVERVLGEALGAPEEEDAAK